MGKGTLKRIPENSVVIVFKFPSPTRLESFLDDSSFHEITGKIQVIAMKHEGKGETNALTFS